MTVTFAAFDADPLINPTPAQVRRFAAAAGAHADHGLIMINWLRFRARAAYDAPPPDAGAPDVSGQEAFARYLAAARPVMERLEVRGLGGGIPGPAWIGDGDDDWDRVLVARYRSVGVFAAAMNDPVYRAQALPHRTAALARTRVLPVFEQP